MSIEWPAHGLKLQARIESGDATIGIIGMGYVGLVEAAKLVVDTRNACGKAGITAPNIVRA